jgi:uroporphyrinogen decarboxylase
MGNRERCLAAIRGDRTDRVPTHVSFTPAAAEQAAGWLRVAASDLPQVLDNHLITCFVRAIDRTEGNADFDLWGVGWDNTINDGFQIHVHPLAEMGAVSAYRCPDPDDPRLYAEVSRVVGENDGRLAVFGDMGFTLWERYYLLRGFEQAMEDLLTEPALVDDLLDQITETMCGIAAHLVRAGIDVGYTGDDFGSQRGLLFSPAVWRRFLRPRYERLWSIFRSANMPVCHHSCGDVRAILDEMADIGLDLLCPVQTQAMPADELANRWGHRLAFWGGISTQGVLPFGTREQILAHIQECRDTLGRRGRYILGPSHDMTSDVPRDNFFAMLEGMQIEPKRAV